MKIEAATRLRKTKIKADWWTDLGKEGQDTYITEHPQSKKAKEKFEKDGEEGEKPEDKKSVSEKPKQKPLAPGKPLAHFAQSKDDPAITADKVYSNFSDDDVQEMKDKVKEAMRLEPSDKKFTDKAGNYSPERLKLHQDIISSVLSPEKIKAATPPKGTKPTFVVLGGRGGSGKSAFTHDEHTGEPAKVNEFDSKKFLTLDADAVKQLLDPPYEGWNANQVHEESSFLFDKIADMAQKMGLNIISDATLKSDKMGPVLQGLIDQGYEVEGHYMFLPRQKAASRACGRYLKKGKESRGRLVPPEVILGNTQNEANFDKLKPLFKKWSAYNNDVAKGEDPQLIDHSDYASKTEANVIRKVMAAKSNPKADAWENDPYLDYPNAKRAEKVANESNQSLYQLGIKPEQIKDEHERAAYIAWINKNEN